MKSTCVIIFAVLSFLSAAQQFPGSREGHAFHRIDANNILVFGGRGVDSKLNVSELNDVWKYDIQSRTFTFLKGSDVKFSVGHSVTSTVIQTERRPGARYDFASTTLKLALYVYGGFGYGSTASGLLNDLWVYDFRANDWSWLKGSNVPNQAGSYSTLTGFYGNQYYPGARRGAGLSVDYTLSQLILFGGDGYGASGGAGKLNDVWNFNLFDRTWAWSAGTSSTNRFGSLSTGAGEYGLSNRPGGRSNFVFTCVPYVSLQYADCYIFGGFGFNNQGEGFLNDLWTYREDIKMFAYWKGSLNGANAGATFGPKRVASPAVSPGGISNIQGYFDVDNDRLVVYGGFKIASTSLNGNLNDVWALEASTKNWAWLSGDYSIDTLAVQGSKPGSRRSHGVASVDGRSFFLFGGDGYGTGVNAKGLLNDLWRYDIEKDSFEFITGSLTVGVSSSFQARAGLSSSAQILIGTIVGGIFVLTCVGILIYRFYYGKKMELFVKSSASAQKPESAA